jgi:hypothetical protein
LRKIDRPIDQRVEEPIDTVDDDCDGVIVEDVPKCPVTPRADARRLEEGRVLDP